MAPWVLWMNTEKFPVDFGLKPDERVVRLGYLRTFLLLSVIVLLHSIFFLLPSFIVAGYQGHGVVKHNTPSRSGRIFYCLWTGRVLRFVGFFVSIA